jgi:hypothetical protein
VIKKSNLYDACRGVPSGGGGESSLSLKKKKKKIYKKENTRIHFL